MTLVVDKYVDHFLQNPADFEPKGSLMAKGKTPVDPFVTDEAETPKRVPMDKSVRKAVNLLREIGGCYRDAAIALAKGDDVEYVSSMELITTYVELFEKLARKSNDKLTAEGLASVTES